MKAMILQFFGAWTIIWPAVAIALNVKSAEELKLILSEYEWDSLIGTRPYTNSALHSIVQPKVLTHNNSHHIQLHIGNESILGHQHVRLQLMPSPSLLATNAIILESFYNYSQPLYYSHADFDCFYRNSHAALSVCNGVVKGLIQWNNTHDIFIHPIPARLHTSNDHLLTIREHTPVQCLHSNGLNIRRRRHIYEGSASFGGLSLGPSAVFVETAVFVDSDLHEHMKSNFPTDTERELIRFVLAMVNAVQLLYHDPSLGRPVNFVLKRLDILKEEAPGLERSPDIDRFLSNFCEWQQTKNPSGDKDQNHWDHALILTGLDLYVRGKHGKISNQVVGLAPVAGMCTATSSCTVNEGRHFESVYVVAHEIGHNLGMRHDGPVADNECDPTSYIMSPTLGSGKITWSSCSRRYLQKFLDTPQSRCLWDHGSSAGQLDHGAEGALPGERFDSNQQCMLKYGRGSKHSSQQPLDDVCRDLHCERERYTWTSHPALEGTLCGVALWCRGGRCVPKAPSSAALKSSISSAVYNNYNTNIKSKIRSVSGWSDWSTFSDCASGCLFGEEGRLSSGSTGIMFSTRTCVGAKEQCFGAKKRYKACNAKQCLNVAKLTVKEFASQVCTRAKDVDDDLTGVGVQKTNAADGADACVIWCYQKRSSHTKSRRWPFPDGTVCQTRNSGPGSQYCIGGRCQRFYCFGNDTHYEDVADACPMKVDRSDTFKENDSKNTVGISPSWTTKWRSKSSWRSVSGCHFNCILPGSGLRLVVSKSNKLPKSNIQLCQADHYGCGRIKSPFEYASLVCGKYKERVRRLSGVGMQLSSAAEDPDRSCRVACQDERLKHRFYLVNGDQGWFPFGTDCTRGFSGNKKAFCVSGKCLDFGADDTPLPESEFALPLLARSTRSIILDGSYKTKVVAKLNHRQLEEIVSQLNETINGKVSAKQTIDIDWSNPIHVSSKHISSELQSQHANTESDNAT